MRIYALDRNTVVGDYTDKRILRKLIPSREFRFEASRHEYFVVRLLIEADYNFRKVKVSTGVLESSSGKVFEHAVTCFQAGGIDINGAKFTRELSFTEGLLQPLHIGFDFSKADIDDYSTVVKIGREEVKLHIRLNDELVFNEGVELSGGYARLKWLNSTVLCDKKIVKCLEAISAEKNALSMLGKRVKLGNDGFIDNVESYFSESNALTQEVQNELFYRPFEFVAIGQKFKYNKLKITSRTNSAVLNADGKSDKLRIDVAANVMYEGLFEYAVTLTSDVDTVIEDILIKAYFKACDYFSGLGKEGGTLAEDISIKHSDGINSYAVFVGDINCGARIALRGSSARRVVSPYNNYDAAPDVATKELWGNFGKGSIDLTRTQEGVEFAAHTGKVVFVAGQSKTYYFTVHLTPFKPLNLKNAFANAIGNDCIEDNYGAMISRAARDGMKFVNVTTRGELNSIKNYPFDKHKALKELSLVAHKRKIGLALSYNCGEISASAAEADVFRTIGDEIIMRRPDKGENNSVLLPIVESTEGGDKAMVTVGGSRIENYYAEGVNYIINKLDLNAITMHNPVITRNGAERVAKCVTRKRSLDGMVELGFNNRYNEANGYASALTEYVDILPFVTKLYSEDGDMGRSSDYIITELSGLVYGLTAAAPYDAGICRSLVFGMLPKYGMDSDISEAIADVVKLFNDFDAAHAEMKGFWDSTNPVRVDNKAVCCTNFINGGDMITVLYNSSPNALRFDIGVENRLGFTTVGKKVYLPKIRGMQSARKINFNHMLRLRAHRGMIIVVKERDK